VLSTIVLIEASTNYQFGYDLQNYVSV